MSVFEHNMQFFIYTMYMAINNGYFIKKLHPMNIRRIIK